MMALDAGSDGWPMLAESVDKPMPVQFFKLSARRCKCKSCIIIKRKNHSCYTSQKKIAGTENTDAGGVTTTSY